MTKEVKYPKGSDAEAAAELEGGGSLAPANIGGAMANLRNTEEANERSAETAKLDLPTKVQDMDGGSGALPQSLEPALANAKNARAASTPKRG